MRHLVKSSVLVLIAGAAALAASPEMERARRLYNATDFDGSLRILQAIPQRDAAAEELTGLNYFMLGEYKKATESLEKAVTIEPDSAIYSLWLGRAFGRRAETANPFSAPGLASKTHQYFERAVQLDPHSLDALNDLFDYYLDAPGFLGGGVERAQSLVPKLAVVSQVDADAALARIAEKHKEYSSAEAHLRRATELAPQRVGVFIDLAKFFLRQGRVQDADQSIARAEKINPNAPKVLLAKADLLIRTNRNPAEAKQLLERFLTLNLTPDDPPRSDAEKLLKKVRGV